MAERKAARRARLLEAAVRLFGRHGYHTTTVPMIVNEAGSSTGSFYLYFRNKEDIFAAALEWLGGRIAEALNEAVARQRETVAQMRAAVERFVTFLAENPGQARILIVESAGLSERLERIRRGVIESHARGVERALEALSAGPAEVTARCWVGAVYESVYHWLELQPERRMAAAALAKAVADFNLRAIGAAG